MENVLLALLQNDKFLPTLLGALIAASAGFITAFTMFIFQLYKEARTARKIRRQRNDAVWRALEVAGGYLLAAMPTKSDFELKGYSWQAVQKDMKDTYDHLIQIRPAEAIQQTSEQEIMYAILLNSVMLCSRVLEGEDFWKEVASIKALIKEATAKLSKEIEKNRSYLRRLLHLL